MDRVARSSYYSHLIGLIGWLLPFTSTLLESLMLLARVPLSRLFLLRLSFDHGALLTLRDLVVGSKGRS